MYIRTVHTTVHTYIHIRPVRSIFKVVRPFLSITNALGRGGGGTGIKFVYDFKQAGIS